MRRAMGSVRGAVAGLVMLAAVWLLLAGQPMQARASADDGQPSRLWAFQEKPLDQIGPSCVGYALQEFLMTEPHPFERVLNGTFIWQTAQYFDDLPGENPSDGTSIEAGIQVLVQYGYVSTYTRTRSIVMARDWLLTKGPIVVGSGLPEGMRWPNGNGYVHVSGEQTSSHAFECNGLHGDTWDCLEAWGWWPISGPTRGTGRFRILESSVAILVNEHGAEFYLITKSQGQPNPWWLVP